MGPAEARPEKERIGLNEDDQRRFNELSGRVSVLETMVGTALRLLSEQSEAVALDLTSFIENVSDGLAREILAEDADVDADVLRGARSGLAKIRHLIVGRGVAGS